MTMTPALTHEEAVAWATDLHLEAVIAELRTAARRWPRHVAREISVEYRRYLVMRVLYADVDVIPGCLLREFDRAARQVLGDDSGLPVDDNLGSDERQPSRREDVGPLYQATFGRPVPETWFTEDLDRFLGSSQPGVVG